MKWQVGEIILQLKDFMNKKYLDIRKHYVDADTQEVKPGKQGIMMNKETFEKVFAVIKDNYKEIEEYFNTKWKT